MGTPRPLVHIEAATLAGGGNNQDRYAYGDGWAFVLDGATSYSDTPPIHDGGWYAERLKNALAPRLTKYPNRSTVDIVADSIREAASAHHPSQGPCPTSTIALARWDADQVELYVLGDSYACALTDEGPIILTDDRLKQVGKGLRTEYRRRLRGGHGFDERHREILQSLQRVEAAHRNRLGGYWIASANPSAAQHGISSTASLTLVWGIVLHTDGLSAEVDAPQIQFARDATLLVRHARARVAFDAHGSRFPRSKPQDDVTVVRICMNSEHKKALRKQPISKKETQPVRPRLSGAK